ncbi:MAG: response regulator [Sedimentisphaerales bacterium]|nr:response regulator [Sedimentisphaerales bacterium]
MEPSPLNPNVLFAEDVLINRTLVEIVLKRTGCTVTSCSNGKEAVEQAEKQKFDVILMDIQMPVMDGIEATKLIKAGTVNKNTPIIALTANSSKEDAMMCLDAGFDDHLSKSAKHESLIRKIYRYAKQADSVRRALSGGEIVSLLADEQEYQKTIETFINDLPDRIRHLQIALENGNLQAFAKEIHSLKGLGGFAGFPIYTEKAKEIESMLHSDQIEKVKEQVVLLIQLCTRTKRSHQDSKNT